MQLEGIERTERLLVGEQEAMQLLGIGRSTLLDHVYAGQIPSVRIGKRRLYSVEALRDWVRQQSAMTAAK